MIRRTAVMRISGMIKQGEEVAIRIKGSHFIVKNNFKVKYQLNQLVVFSGMDTIYSVDYKDIDEVY